MKIKIGEFDFSETWDGVFYKKLSHYPNITEWEMQSIFDFIKTDYTEQADHLPALKKNKPCSRSN